jgi:metal-responsive CopG/Arc/MetJ family transcriptional regulator
MVLTIDLPNWIIEDIDDLAKKTKLSRSEIIKEMLEYILDHKDLSDEIFPSKEKK